MLDIYVKEFIAITKYLLDQGVGHVQKDNNLGIERDILVGLMKKNMYEESLTKLSVWRGMNWIITEEDRFTKLAKSGIDGKFKRMVVINMDVYNTLCTITTRKSA